jgi:hypothetical protein
VRRWKVNEYKLTEKTIYCEHCGNNTLMKIVTQGIYVKDIITTEAPEQIYYNFNILVCSYCENFNIIQEAEWSEADDEEDGVDSNGDIIFIAPQPQKEYLYPSSKDFKEAEVIIKNTYKQAVKCFKSKLYTPSVLMCRKTIECLCLEQLDIKERYTLDGKIERMRDEKIIDNMLYEWAKALKDFGNDAAHSLKEFNEKDAKDILDFTFALVEYCVDFKFKFWNLLKRTNKKIETSDVEDKKDILKLKDTEISLLEKALQDTNENFRYYAAITLANSKEKIEHILPVLIDFIINEHKEFKSGATDSIKKIGADAVSELLKLLTNTSNKKDCLTAIRILGDMGSNAQTALPNIINIINNSDYCTDVQNKATNALAKIGKEAVSTFVQMYE